jgi:hypothetical protein
VSVVILLITPTVAGYYTRWVANNTPQGVPGARGVLSCYIVAFGPLETGVVARVQLGHRLRSAPDESPLGHPPQSV